MNDNVVAEYDYYTLEQARKIIYAEMQRDRERLSAIAKRKRNQQVERIKFLIGLFAGLVLPPVLMGLHWITFGY